MTRKLQQAAEMLINVLELAIRSHGVMLLTYPPQDAWIANSVSSKAREAVIAMRGALAESELRVNELEAKIRETLDGIDETEASYQRGWWETSAEVEFGREKLVKVLDSARDFCR